jgi:hypothetical protein
MANDASSGAFKLAGAFLVACSAALIITSGWGAATAGMEAIKAGAVLPKLFGDVALGVGAGAMGYGLYKAPEWAASPAK